MAGGPVPDLAVGRAAREPREGGPRTRLRRDRRALPPGAVRPGSPPELGWQGRGHRPAGVPQRLRGPPVGRRGKAPARLALPDRPECRDPFARTAVRAARRRHRERGDARGRRPAAGARAGRPRRARAPPEPPAAGDGRDRSGWSRARRDRSLDGSVRGRGPPARPSGSSEASDGRHRGHAVAACSVVRVSSGYRRHGRDRRGRRDRRRFVGRGGVEARGRVGLGRDRHRGCGGRYSRWRNPASPGACPRPAARRERAPHRPELNHAGPGARGRAGCGRDGDADFVVPGNGRAARGRAGRRGRSRGRSWGRGRREDRAASEAWPDG